MNTSAILLISALSAAITFSYNAYSGGSHDHHDDHEKEHEEEHDEEAHDGHDHSAHHHGTGHLNIAVEGNAEASVVSIYLQAPGADILGFERVPDDSEEKEALIQARATLDNADALFSFGDVECIATDESGMEVSESGNYTDVVAEYTFNCGSAPTLVGVNIQSYFSDLEVLKAVWVSDDGQGVMDVTASTTQITLR